MLPGRVWLHVLADRQQIPALGINASFAITRLLIIRKIVVDRTYGAKASSRSNAVRGLNGTLRGPDRRLPQLLSWEDAIPE